VPILPHDAMLVQYMLWAMSVHLSLCPSQVLYLRNSARSWHSC